jgi:3-hydroxyacyl-[acyl-carrier-protein] dehydratase
MSMNPQDLLPHRPPFLFLDEISELTPEAARATYRYKPGDYFFAGHFPGDPVVPGVIQIETMAQLVMVLGLHNARIMALPATEFVLAMADGCRFHALLRPGDTVVVRAEKHWLRHRAMHATATLHRATTGDLVAEATLRAMLRS